MAVEQSVPQGPRIDVSPVTDEQLCNPGAAKLMYKRVTELEADNNGLRAELAIERQRNGELLTRLHTSDTNRRVLDERVRSMGHRGAVSHLVQFVIVVLLAYAIDSAKSQHWTTFAVFVVISVVLGIAVYLVNRIPADTRE